VLHVVVLLIVAPSFAATERPQPSKRELFVALTETAWCTGSSSELLKWDFEPDGRYRWLQLTDYVSPGDAGRWTIDRSKLGWVVALSSGERKDVRLGSDGSLSLGLIALERCGDPKDPELDSLVRPVDPHPRDGPPPIRLPPAVTVAVETLTRNGWTRLDDQDLELRPTSIVFNDDWTYVTLYGKGECRNTGTWYVTTQGIRGSAPKNPCDIRNRGSAEHLWGPLPVAGRLQLDDKYYRPSNPKTP
jgi:hypothetical protein